MARRFRVASGKVAVWEGHTDTLPFDNPLGNLSRVKFHSSIPYVKIVDVKTFTKTIPAIPTGTPDRAQSYTLGPHGRPGQPFVIGKIVVNGVPVAFTGSVPVHQVTSPFKEQFARFLSLGVDASNVYVHEYAVQNGQESTGVYDTRPAQTFTITVYITDILL
jgi:hypothetical protein